MFKEMWKQVPTWFKVAWIFSVLIGLTLFSLAATALVKFIFY